MSQARPWPLRARVAKRLLDVCASSVGLAALGPALVLLGAAVRLDSPGPALFRQARMGRGGRPFRILKLRTMAHGAGVAGPAITAAGDPRVTRLGRLLRRTKLDELPQLWNVLVGDMSLVGPRPEVPRYLPRYRAEDLEVLAVRPGITDPASIAYRDEERVLATAVAGATDDPARWDRVYAEEILPRKLELARRYLREQSLLGDLRLIARTLGTLAR